MLSVPITTNVVSSNHVHFEVYSIQHYVIKFVSDLQQVGGFLWTLVFLHQQNWPSRYNRNIVESDDHRYVPLVVNTSQSFPHSWLITGFVTRLTRWVPPVEEELFILPELLSSCYSIFSFMCMFCRSLFVHLSFFFCPVFSVLRFTYSDYPFGICKLFLGYINASSREYFEHKKLDRSK